MFPAVPNDLFTKQPLKPETEIRVSVSREQNSCLVTTQGKTSQARVFGSSIAWTKFHSDDRGIDVEYKLTVEGEGGVTDATFVLAFSEEGADAARRVYAECQEGQNLFCG